MSTTEQPMVLGPESNGILMTPEEFDDAEEWNEDYVYELINGVLIVSPPPSEGERGPNEFLGYLLLRYRDDHPQGAALDYTLQEHYVRPLENRRRADRVIWAGFGCVPNVRRDLPSIVVEFVSKGRRNRIRDYEVKRREYLDCGIREYWIIDRFARTLTVALKSDTGETQQQIAEEEVYTTEQLPGFELRPAQLFAEADKLEQAQAADCE